MEAEEPATTLVLRVLAAEDNSVNQLVLKTLLHQIGVEPVVVGDGLEALEAWETSHWDVILMDVQMPRMDGLAATRAIRERELAIGRQRTPIIALTANRHGAPDRGIQGCRHGRPRRQARSTPATVHGSEATLDGETAEDTASAA